MNSEIKLVMSPYEEEQLKIIHEWKSPNLGFLGRNIQSLNDQVEKRLSFINDNKIIKKAIGLAQSSSQIGEDLFKRTTSKASEEILNLLNSLSQKTVSQKAIIKEFNKNGIEIETLDELNNYDLEDIDKTIGYLALKYSSLATVEGIVAGGASIVSPVAGAAAIPADIIALLTINLRAIGEYATYCGYDVSLQEERLFILNILLEASSSSDVSKSKAMGNLVKIAKDTAAKKSWKELERNMIVQVLQGVSKALGVRLTKAKLANIIPALGAVVTSGYNVYFTNRVCAAAFHLYRERFLADKYMQEEMIEETVNIPSEYIVLDE